MTTSDSPQSPIRSPVNSVPPNARGAPGKADQNLSDEGVADGRFRHCQWETRRRARAPAATSGRVADGKEPLMEMALLRQGQIQVAPWLRGSWLARLPFKWRRPRSSDG